jgi:hypothetical protein
LAPNDFWLFQEINSALKERRLQDNEDIEKRKSDNGTESCSTTEIPKMFPTVG